VQGQVVRIVGQGDEVTTGQIPFTPRAKKVLELALREAISLGHDYIDTEHILLALVRVDGGVAAQILLDFGAGQETIRDAVIRMLGGQAVRPARSARNMTAFRHVRHGASLLVIGWLLFAIALGVGVLVGWAIWGH
jgi:ATP-dependent Clp protease ATP-binding subunit ClpC